MADQITADEAVRDAYTPARSTHPDEALLQLMGAPALTDEDIRALDAL